MTPSRPISTRIDSAIARANPDMKTDATIGIRRLTHAAVGTIVAMKKYLAVTAVLVSALALAACSSPAPSTTPSSSAAASPSATSKPSTSASSLAVMKTSLGSAITDAKGNSLYLFDSDVQNSGASTCYDDCATLWPPLLTTTATPDATGVTGKLGTITRTDGTKQVTVNGWPVYYYADDKAPGDVNGQAFKDVWWLLTPAGERLK